MAGSRTAAQIVRYDQSLAGACAEIDLLVRVLAARGAEAGEPQALADVCALVSGRAPAELAGLLTAALQRLAAQAQPAAS